MTSSTHHQWVAGDLRPWVTSALRPRVASALHLVLASLLALAGCGVAWGQQADEFGGARAGAEAPVPVDAAEIQSVMNDQPAPEASAAAAPSGIDLLTLIMRGGAFMIPIAVMSLMVVALAFERLASLRKQRILPRRFERDIKLLSDPMERFDPTAAFETCRSFPSPAARVVKAMLLRTGQPLSEIERAATETVEREADKCASPIRWLSLAAAATPLMGLLGTVWGMIVAFHESTTLTADRSRSEQLSEGIYTALVTTLAGLVVAIPAAMLALYLENRLAKLFHRVEEFAFDLAPALARFTGRRRLDNEGVMHTIDHTSNPVRDLSSPPPPPRPAQQHDGTKVV